MFVHCSLYFQPDRNVSHRRLYIGAGFGRTGTTSCYRLFGESGFLSMPRQRVSRRGDNRGVTIHEHSPVTTIATWYLDKHRNRSLSDMLDFIKPRKPVAVFDNPTGIYLWELMSAFPNNTVILTTRQVCAHTTCLRGGAVVRPPNTSAALRTGRFG